MTGWLLFILLVFASLATALALPFVLAEIEQRLKDGEHDTH